MTIATIGSRYQVVIPRQVRARLKLKPKSKVEVEARDDHVVIYPIGETRYRGIGRELADGTDAADYVRRLREEWSDRP